MSKRFALYLGILLGLYLVFLLWSLDAPWNGDFAKFYESVKLYSEGQNIYSPLTIDRFVQWQPEWDPPPGRIYPNLNPPFLTLLLLPLGYLDYPHAFLLWSLLSLSCGMAGIGLVEAETRQGPPERFRQLLFLIALLAYYPTFATIQYGQLSLFLLLLLSGAWATTRRGQEILGGTLLGLALSVKFFFALFALFFLVRRHWRVLFALTVTFALCSALAAWVFGVESYLEYRSVLKDISWQSNNWNASLLGFFTRVLGGSESDPLFEAPRLGRVLASLGSVLLALMLALLVWPRPDDSSPRVYDLGFSLTIVAMFLISPLGWSYYFPLLSIPFLVVLGFVGQDSQTRAMPGLLLASFILTALPIPLKVAFVDAPFHWYIWSSFSFYALLILFGLLVFLLCQKRQLET